MWYQILLITISYVTCHPIQEETTIDDITTQNIIKLQRDVNLVSYIQNFKTVMAEYVNAQYTNLTLHEMEKVRATLEEFLQEFAKDLKETIVGVNNDISLSEDGLQNSTFQDIKTKIVQEFPDVNEDTAEIIVAKLRKNLLKTRHRLDEIIRHSQKAAFDNAND